MGMDRQTGIEMKLLPMRTLFAGIFALTDRPTQSLGLNGVWYHLQVDQVR